MVSEVIKEVIKVIKEVVGLIPTSLQCSFHGNFFCQSYWIGSKSRDWIVQFTSALNRVIDLLVPLMPCAVTSGLLRGVCTLPLCLCGFSPGSPASFSCVTQLVRTFFCPLQLVEPQGNRVQLIVLSSELVCNFFPVRCCMVAMSNWAIWIICNKSCHVCFQTSNLLLTLRPAIKVCNRRPKESQVCCCCQKAAVGWVRCQVHHNQSQGFARVLNFFFFWQQPYFCSRPQ